MWSNLMENSYEIAVLFRPRCIQMFRMEIYWVFNSCRIAIDVQHFNHAFLPFLCFPQCWVPRGGLTSGLLLEIDNVTKSCLSFS
jgi:hypothetical protein